MTGLLGVLLALDLVVAAYLAFRLIREARQTRLLRAHVEQQAAQAATLAAEVERLRVCSVIPNAEEQAAALVLAAQQQALEISAQYESYVAEVIAWTNQAYAAATAQADKLIKEAQEKLEEPAPAKLFYKQTEPVPVVVTAPASAPALAAAAVLAPAAKSAPEGPLKHTIVPHRRLPVPAPMEESWMQHEISFSEPVQREIATEETY
jgi:hypothetical protein